MLDRGGYRDSPYLDRAWRPRGPLSLPIVLILIHAAVFVVQIFAWAVTRVNLAHWFGVRADLVVERFYVWQIVTYMFLHDPAWIWHIVFNMYILWAFGTPLEGFVGRRRFLVLYFGGGLVGGLAYCAMQYLPGSHATAVGASACVMAVVIFYAIHFPNQTILLFFIIPIRIKWAALLIIGIDVLGAIGAYGGDIAHSAHLGGALFAWLFARYGQRVERYFQHLERREHRRDAQRRDRAEKKLDDILAKITREGFDSLTPRERKFLQEQSKNRRDRHR
jgi:membrane associated rhomboid family serine protease